MTSTHHGFYIGLLQREVVPALGCTDPVGIAFACATAVRALGRTPESISISLSRNLFKNAMAVGIPGTGGRSGIDLAAALGAFAGQPERGLRVLEHAGPDGLASADRFLAASGVAVSIADTTESLYARVTVGAGDDIAVVVLQGDYTRIVGIEKNGAPVQVHGVSVAADATDPATAMGADGAGAPGSTPAAGGTIPAAVTSPDKTDDLLSIRSIVEFADTVPADRIGFIADAAAMNEALSAEGLSGSWGHQVGKRLVSAVRRGRLSDDLSVAAAISAAGAADARMAGASMPAMSNSGSGNQGITATMPVVAVARSLGVSGERLHRALVLSHLVAIHQKQHWNRLSAMCGTIAAGTGSAAGIVYLLGGGYAEIAAAVGIMAADLAGMVCDGAKPGCAFKVSTAATSAVRAALLAMDGVHVDGSEGIVAASEESTIDNVARLSSEGMLQADAMVLDMMLGKTGC